MEGFSSSIICLSICLYMDNIIPNVQIPPGFSCGFYAAREIRSASDIPKAALQGAPGYGAAGVPCCIFPHQMLPASRCPDPDRQQPASYDRLRWQYPHLHNLFRLPASRTGHDRRILQEQQVLLQTSPWDRTHTTAV